MSIKSPTGQRSAGLSNCALTIAGLDPGGGAGILADMRAFQAAGVFGAAAIALTTVQSTHGLREAVATRSTLVAAQAREVLKHQRVTAIKIGALGSSANVRAVADVVRSYRALPMVLDPVMVPTRGHARLLDARALNAVKKHLLPLATVVTANVHEAEVLTGVRVTRLADARVAARALVAMGAKVAMVKGGHLSGRTCVDVIAYEGGEETELTSDRLALKANVHGSGCTLAALLCGRLAAGASMDVALLWAKNALFRALCELVDVGGPMRVLMPRAEPYV